MEPFNQRRGVATLLDMINLDTDTSVFAGPPNTGRLFALAGNAKRPAQSEQRSSPG